MRSHFICAKMCCFGGRGRMSRPPVYYLLFRFGAAIAVHWRREKSIANGEGVWYNDKRIIVPACLGRAERRKENGGSQKGKGRIVAADV